MDITEVAMPYKRLLCYQHLINSQVESLIAYIQESGTRLATKQRELDKELKDLLKETTDSDATSQINEDFVDENIRHFKDFPCFFNESAFLIVYSFFESSLFQICKYAQWDLNAAHPNNPISLTPKGSYIQNSKAYLENTCRISLKAQQTRWNKLIQLRNLRNFLAHSNLNLAHEKDPVQKEKNVAYINRLFKKPLVIDRKNKYKLESHNFNLAALEIMKSYLLFVIKQAIKKCK